MASLQWNREFALEQTAGDEELLDELMILFRDSSASDMEKLKAAVLQQDMDSVIAAAHSLKGASASLGIEGIRLLAMEIEENAREKTLNSAMEKVDALAELLVQLNEI